MATNTSNPLEMSDEDFLNEPQSSFEEELADDEPEQDEPENEEDDVIEETLDDDGGVNDEGNEDGEPDDEPQGEEEEAQESEEPESGEEQEEEEITEENSEEENSDPIPDAEEQLKRLFAPFKANGKEITIDSVDDAITLMQMGANYAKKMSGLKPHLRIVKMLENNELLDEGKLNYLIDLSKKNPQAIARLLKESGVDPLDVDLEQGENYKPSTYTVKDEEVALDEVLSELRSTPSYKRTIDVISNKWDDPSKEILLQNPHIIRLINDHVASGIYDEVMADVEKERMLGRLNGMSDLDAYKFVGDRKFASANATQATQQKTTPKTSKPSDDPKLKDRRKAASPTRAKSPAKADTGYNPLALSDEEFEKLAAKGKLF